ncbi:MAG TPA: hypothetical protein VEU30_12535 [Thermoanaerobaculia bacterium]|nr:hypothetical protein [Thermoanaerobaculia bacterium]
MKTAHFWSLPALLLTLTLSAQDAISPMALFHQQASGTSLMPAAAPMEMRMFSAGQWHVMLHGVAFLNDIQQSGPRGRDDQFSTNWLMAAASRPVGAGAMMFRVMLSAEPATIDDQRYPLLFQTGETANGLAIIDGQHPHEFFMELAAEYARPIGKGTGYLYLAPHGDAALGPVAFPHRPSAAEIPQAVLSHHHQDSTHIASTVVTAGYRRGPLTFEMSGFHGAEPDEERWDVQLGAIDSWSTRVTWTPTFNLVAQVSHGELTKPEALEPGDASRTTASIAWERPLGRAHLSSTVVYGIINKKWYDQKLDSYLAEGLLRLGNRHWISTRFERMEKDELFPHAHPPVKPVIKPNIPTFTVSSALVGYTFDFLVRSPVRLGIGANMAFHSIDEDLELVYGEAPRSKTVFLRARLIGN